jgi:hypothetical protein
MNMDAHSKDVTPIMTLPPEGAQRISREEMRDLPIGRYEGPVRLVAAPAARVSRYASAVMSPRTTNLAADARGGLN